MESLLQQIKELKDQVKKERQTIMKEQKRLQNKAYYESKKEEIKAKNLASTKARYHNDETYRAKQREYNKQWYQERKKKLYE